MNASEEGWWRFLQRCVALKNEQDLDEFLTLVLTHEEKADISGRIKIIEELLKGEKTQREIAEHCRVSIAKITRGSNFLKTISKKLRNFLQQPVR